MYFSPERRMDSNCVLLMFFHLIVLSELPLKSSQFQHYGPVMGFQPQMAPPHMFPNPPVLEPVPMIPPNPQVLPRPEAVHYDEYEQSTEEADGSLASNLGAAIFRGAKTKKRGLPSTDHLYKQVIINRFQILHVLGKGSFGEVRAGKILGTNIEVAIKFEPLKYKPTVYKEYLFYSKLKAFVGSDFNKKAPRGLPTVYYYGRFMNFIVLVMEKVGESLKRLLDATQKLSLGTVARIGKQMMLLAKLVHSAGIVHRDIKPANFTLDSTGYYVTILDFGLADYYVNRKTKAVKRFRLGRSFAGTLKFMSTAASMAMQYSPADDLYEIGYTLVALLYGRLPWQDAAEIKEKRQRVLQTTKMKFITTHQELCKGLQQCVQYFSYLDTLPYGVSPDYQYLYQLFQSIITSNGYSEEHLIEPKELAML